ncbi:COG1470 family protein [Thermococcus sp.]
MRRALFVIFILVLILPYAQAGSVLSGWFRIPGRITAGSSIISIEDISIGDKTLLISLNNSTEILNLGSVFRLGDYNLSFSHVLLDSRGYANMEFHFPYLLEGQSVKFGAYRILLDSVSEKEAALRITYKNITKDIAYKGGTVSFENLRISMKLMPLIFDGYLYRGDMQKIGGWNVTFEGYNITNETGGLTEIIRLRINGREYFGEVGKTLEAGGLQIEVKDLVGSEYLRVRTRLKGAYVSIQVLPYFDGWIAEGKTTKLGPYIVRIDGIYMNRVYISIRNSCGVPLRSAFITAGNFTSMLSYGGLSVGALEVRRHGSEKQVRIVAMLDESKVPKIEDVAFLNVSFRIPEEIKEYVPFKATVVLKNTGKTDLRYLEIIPNISREFEIVGDYPRYIPLLKRGGEIEFPLMLKATSGGNLTVGNIEVTAHAPYFLSCNGLVNLTFSSEVRRTRVKRAVFNYKVEIRGRNGEVGEVIPVNISVENLGNSELPFALTVAVPEGFGVMAKNFTMYGEWLKLRDSMPPNQTKVYLLSLIPSRKGKYEIMAVVSAGSEIFKNSTIITVSGVQEPPRSEQTRNVTNSTCKPKVITQIIKVPVPQNTTVAAEGMGLKQKLLYFGGSFFGGMAFILLLAWIAAKMEERRS